MSDHVVFIGFGTPVRGREAESVTVFNQFIEMLTGMAGDGRVKSMDVFLLDPHGGDLGGFFLVRGDAAQCAALPNDEQFRRTITDALLIVDNLGVVQGRTGEALNREMGMYMESVGKLGAGGATPTGG